MSFDFAKLAWDSAGFLLNNWQAIATFIGFVMVWQKNKDATEAKAAKESVLKMSIDAVKLLASQTLGTQEKRQRAIEMVLEAMPSSVAKHVTKEQVGPIVEAAWRNYVKPTLDNGTNVKPELEKSEVPEVK